MEDWALPTIFIERCTGCGLCAQYCPTGVLTFADRKPLISQPGACAYCGICEEVCPANAIELSFYFSKE